MKKALFVSMVAVALLAALVVAMQVAAAPITAQSEASGVFAPTAGTVNISVVPSNTIYPGAGTVDVAAWIYPVAGEDIKGATVHLDFDPNFLEVATLMPNYASGMSFPKFVFDNVVGTIDVDGGFLGPATTNPHKMMDISFNVKAGAEGASEVTFVMTGTRETKVRDALNDDHIVIPQDGTVIVQVEQTLTVTVAPAGAVAAGANVGQNPAPPYMTMDVVELTASSPDACWTFLQWEGDLTGATNPDSITMDADKEVTATFEAPLFALTLTPVGNGTIAAVPDKPGGYDCGESVELTANADAGARFVEWTGALTGSTNPDTVTMDGDYTVTATFVDTVTLAYSDTLPGGTVTVEEENPDGNYDVGEIITITANAGDCYVFDGWTGSLEGQPNPAVVTLSADLIFEATFVVPDYDVTVNIVNGEGVTGTVALDPAGGTYACGTEITLTASISDGVGVFSVWSGDLTGSVNPATVTVDDNKVITATFLGTIPWTFDPNPDGGTVGTEPPQPVDGFIPGTVVTLTATPDYCYQFDGWTGDLVSYGTQNPLVLTAMEPLSFTAEFSMITYTLTTVVDPLGKGTVAVDPDQMSYDCGTTITATATVTESLWVFDSWSGALTGSDNPDSFVLDEDSGTTLTAHFKQYKIYLPLVMRNN